VLEDIPGLSPPEIDRLKQRLDALRRAIERLKSTASGEEPLFASELEREPSARAEREAEPTPEASSAAAVRSEPVERRTAARAKSEGGTGSGGAPAH
jgi:hypothetical protein